MTDRALRYIPNSTQVMDVYFDKYMALLTGAEWKTLCYAIRRIFGFKRESDWISLDQFVNGIVKRDGTRLDNGTGMARGTVVKALDFLKKVHLLQTRGVLGSTPEYSLNLDPELIDHKTLSKRHADTEKGNHQKVAKARKHNPRVGVSVPQKTDTRSVPQDDPRSVPQNTQESVNQQSADNSSELGVPNSTELAENVSTHLSATPVLNPAEREILRACNDGVVIAHYHNAEAANHLIALGMIERCERGLHEVLCLKGKCPQHDACPDDVKVQELQTAIQTAFLPGSNGNQPETVVTPSPQTPLPPPAPAALPEVPKSGTLVSYPEHTADGLEILYASMFVDSKTQYRVHFRKAGKIQCLCGVSSGATIVKPYEPDDSRFHVCGKCQRGWDELKTKAAARAQGKAPREHDVLFKACATEIMGYAPENGMKYTKGQCSQINSVKGAIMRVMNLDKTPADYQRGADEIPKYKRTYKEKHPNLDYPTHASFETFFKAHWDTHQPKPEPDTSCPDCHGTQYKLIKDKFGVDVAHPCPSCQKVATP